MSALLSIAFWEQALGGGTRLAVPVGLAALGENVGERSGTFNIGIEGAMAMGAFSGFAVAAETGSPILGLLTGMLVGSLVGFAFAMATVVGKGNEVVVGFAFALAGTGIATFFFRAWYSHQAPPPIETIAEWRLPFLSSLPLVGSIFSQTPLVYILPIVALATGMVLFRTRLGLEIRACGENPTSAEARGVRVRLLRIGAQVVSGSIVGLAGSILSVGLIGGYEETITGGRGFVAIALVIVGRWRPSLIAASALGFGTLQSLQLRIQGELGIPSQLLAALPFAITLLVMAVASRRQAAPAALGQDLIAR